jgi:hypothetical protein
MAELPIRWIRARTYCHATEDEERVNRALSAAVAGGRGSRQVLQGQFGNAVVLLAREIDHAAEFRETWSQWSTAGLPAALLPAVEDRVDANGILHFRLDKQKAYQGILVLSLGGDPIDVQVKLKAFPANPAEIRRVAHMLLTEAK